MGVSWTSRFCQQFVLQEGSDLEGPESDLEKQLSPLRLYAHEDR